jgi:transcriptional regulator with XRE-family HTH domain
MAVRGAMLRQRREELGLSLDELSVATRIPVPHLEALEADRLHELPQGPWADAYRRTLIAELGLSEEDGSEEAEPERLPPPAGAPLWLVRTLAGSSVLALLGLVGWQLWQAAAPVAPDEPVEVIPDQVVVVVARRNTRVRLEVDGEVEVDRALPGGERVKVAGHDQIVLEVPATADVRVEWNGSTLTPQGRQDAPRRLVFVDDVGAR